MFLDKQLCCIRAWSKSIGWGGLEQSLFAYELLTLHSEPLVSLPVDTLSVMAADN